MLIVRLPLQFVDAVFQLLMTCGIGHSRTWHPQISTLIALGQPYFLLLAASV